MSLRLRLFLILVLATGAVWTSAVLWTRAWTEARVERVLDARLSEAARMVASLIEGGGVGVEAAVAAPAGGPAEPGALGYEHRLSCQIWALDGGLLGRSQSAPAERLSDRTGFSTTTVGGEAWRVYTLEDPRTGIRVMVGDTLAMRANLAGSIVAALALPAALVLPALVALIWASLGRGLAPLDRLALVLAGRHASDLSPLPSGPAPRELRPLISALDGLIARVAAVRDSERTFMAFAAHELRTPLAGLKTQAQVAALAPDEATRARALAQIQRSADRTGRMVRQLLDMAALEADADTPEEPPLPLGLVVQDVLEELGPLARERRVSLKQDLGPESERSVTRPGLLALALRNLVENAAAASPQDAEVTVSVAAAKAGGSLLQVRDRGPGLSPEEIRHVMQRFVRGPGATGPGSGLGLAIAELATEGFGGSLRLRPAEGGGLLAEIALPGQPLP